MTTLGKRIRLARGNASQDVFARRIQVSKGSLGFYERDENLPNSDVILKICSATGVTLDWLLLGQGPMMTTDASTTDTSAAQEYAGEQQAYEQSARASMASYARLEQELEIERQERRDLAAENRKLHQEKEALLLQIIELREKVARLEAASREDPSQRTGVVSIRSAPVGGHAVHESVDPCCRASVSANSR